MNYKVERRKSVRDSILHFITDYIKSHSYPPSVREIAYAIGYKSTSSVQNQLDMMIALGMLESDAPKGTPRAIRVPGMKFVEV